MIGSEYLVLDVARRGERIVLTLHVDREVRWTDGARSSNPIGDSLSNALGGYLSDQLRAALAGYSTDQLVLRLRDDELALTRWDQLTGNGVVVDYSEHLSDELVRPVDLPIGILLADLDQRFPYDATRASPMHHFATTALGAVGPERLADTLRRLPHDVVHVRARITQGPDGLWLGTSQSGISERRLRSLLREGDAQTRLVILEIEPSDIDPAFLMARRLRGRAGPTVLVTDDGTDFERFYLSIAHSEDLRDAARNSRTATADQQLPRLVLSDGGTKTLDLRAVEQRFRVAAETQSRRVADLTTRVDLTRFDSRETDALWSSELDDLRFGYHAESAGMEPLSDRSIDLHRAESALHAIEQKMTRVVNTWFADGDGVVPPDSTLRANGHYDICISVGPVADGSNIDMPLPVDEEALAEEANDDGVTELRVVLVSDDVETVDEVRTLRVPRPPAASEVIAFSIVTPSEPGRVAMRLSLYVGHNLLQSIALSAEVTAGSAQRQPGGNSGRVDWAMTGRLDQPDTFGDKAFSIFTNDSGSGTHLVAVESVDFRSHVTLLESQVTNLLRQGRVALQWAAGDPKRNEPYRYAPDNNGTAEQLRIYLTGLAEFGWTMFTTLISGDGNDDLRDDLDASLGSPTTIQFARTTSSRLMYPWALVYDQRLDPSPDNELCPDFLDTVRRKAPIELSACFARGCAHRAETNIVCPSGFWGYRHVVEQPLGAFDPRDDDVVRGHNDAATEILVDGEIKTLVGYHTDLDPVAEHADAVLGLPDVAGSRSSARGEMSTLLQDPLTLVYFFCHGGSADGKAWLDVGGTPSERISPPDLVAWDIRWPTSRPLVFINGCDTVASTPSDLATFNEGLRYCKASGVIGTEIQIPVELGREVGVTLLGYIVRDRMSVGDAVRAVRLDLLSRFNPLGLAYSPYCLAQLQLTG